MERNYFKRRLSTYLLSFMISIWSSSCTIYQNVPDNDGIYSTEGIKKESRIIVQDSDEHRGYEKNYFTRELEKIDRINGTDIITDIETYSSYNDTIPNQSSESINEPTGKAWGYNDSNDVVVTINFNNNWNYRWGGWGWGGFYDPFFSPYPWFSSPRWGWGWNRPYWGRRWNRPFWNPYWGFNRPFWRGGFYAYNGLRTGGYYYGRRVAYRSFNRRGSSLTGRSYTLANRRANTSNFGKNSSTSRRSNSTSVSRRNSSNRAHRNSQEAGRNSSNSKRNRVNNSSSSTKRSSSRSYRPSSSKSRSYNRSSSPSSSRGVSRGGSSRGSGIRGGK